MNKTLSILTVLAFSLTGLGCQQPYRCGARDEPCCNFEGVEPCITDLGLRCNAGVCQAAARTACPAPGACDVGLQNCAAGQGCQVETAGNICRAAGTGTDGASCTTEAQCAPGYFCASAGNVCRRYCCGSMGCAARQTCISGGVAGSALGFCIVTECDAVAQTGCPNAGCYPLALDDGTVITACLAAGTLELGASCDGNVQCVPGTACFGSVCREVCRPSSPSCSSGTCTASPNANDLGACL